VIERASERESFHTAECHHHYHHSQGVREAIRAPPQQQFCSLRQVDVGEEGGHTLASERVQLQRRAIISTIYQKNILSRLPGRIIAARH
jgi:hypothetical protein